MFDSRLSLTADVFFEKRKDILSTRNTLPAITDINLPKINLGTRAGSAQCHLRQNLPAVLILFQVAIRIEVIFL